MQNDEAAPGPSGPGAASSYTAKAFDDVADGSWYEEYVDFASSHELLTGVADRQFAPDGTLTRAMLVTVLYRLEGSPAITA